MTSYLPLICQCVCTGSAYSTLQLCLYPQAPHKAGAIVVDIGDAALCV